MLNKWHSLIQAEKYGSNLKGVCGNLGPIKVTPHYKAGEIETNIRVMLIPSSRPLFPCL